jgi:hypothetical protein
MSARLKDKYQKEVVPALTKEFGYKNVMAVPRIRKVVVNMGLGEATANAKIIDVGADELARITGQKPAVRRAKKSIAAFKLHAGPARSAAVSRNRLHEGRQGARHERVGRHHGEERRRGAKAAPVHRHAVQTELSARGHAGGRRQRPRGIGGRGWGPEEDR